MSHVLTATVYIFGTVTNKTHCIVILSMVARYGRAMEQNTALVCCCSERRTQQVHHRAAGTRGQGNSRRGCHCSLAGRRKLPESHQRTTTGGHLVTTQTRSEISQDCSGSQRYPHNRHFTVSIPLDFISLMFFSPILLICIRLENNRVRAVRVSAFK